MPESEAGFMAAVRELAAMTGWLDYHTHDSRRSTAGFPDLVLVRPAKRGHPARMILAELKTAKGRVTKEQELWLASLRSVAAFAANVQVFVWRPSDWPEIDRQLKSPAPLVPA